MYAKNHVHRMQSKKKDLKCVADGSIFFCEQTDLKGHLLESYETDFICVRVELKIMYLFAVKKPSISDFVHILV